MKATTMIATVLLLFYSSVSFAEDDMKVSEVTNATIMTMVDGGEFMWVGTQTVSGYGLCAIRKATNEPVAYFDNTNSLLVDKSISDIAVDTDTGNLWIANTDFICEYDGETWTTHVPDSHVPYSNYKGVAFDPDGKLWCLSYHSAAGCTVARLAGDSWTSYTKDNDAFLANEPTCLRCDSAGNVWVGSEGGVAMFDGSAWSIFTEDNSDLPDNTITCIECDEQGRVWIGTESGLALYESGAWTVYIQNDSDLPVNWVNDLSVDADGVLWIMTKHYFTGRGMASFDGETWTVYDKNNAGLPDKFLRRIECDSEGNVWVGVDGGGLVKFDGESCTPVPTAIHFTPWSSDSDANLKIMFPATCVLNDKIYVIGGSQTRNDGGIAQVKEYDPVSGKITSKAPMIVARKGSAACVVNGKIYVFGGDSNGTASAKVEKYDPETDTWTSKTAMPTPRAWPACGAVNGKVYVIGGFTGAISLAEVEEYDPETDTWSAKADMPGARDGLAACVVNNKIYAVAGSFSPNSHDITVQSSLYAYDPATDSWETRTNNPIPRAFHSSCTVNGKIYAFGGVTTDSWAVTDKAQVYDPNTDSWSQMESMPAGKYGLSTCAVDNNIFIFGGSTTSPTWTLYSNVDIYELEDPVIVNDAVPAVFATVGNFPNPFNPTTRITYSITEPGQVNLTVYDLLGRKVATLTDRAMTPGHYTETWNAHGFSSGVYFCRLEHGGTVRTHKMLLVK